MVCSLLFASITPVQVGDELPEFTLPLVKGGTLKFPSGESPVLLGVMEGYRSREKNARIMELNRGWQRAIEGHFDSTIYYYAVKNFGRIPGLFYEMGKKMLRDEPYPVAIDTDGSVTDKLLGDVDFRLIAVDSQGVIFAVFAGDTTPPKINRLRRQLIASQN